MVLLVFPPPDHFWIGRNRGKFCGPSDAAGLPTFAKMPAEIAPAAYLRRRSSNANSLRWPFLSQQNVRYYEFSNTWLAHGYLSSSPTTSATQSGLYQPIRERCVAAEKPWIACVSAGPSRKEGTYGLFVPGVP